jgi:hypothetical protein
VGDNERPVDVVSVFVEEHVVCPVSCVDVVVDE